MLIVPKKIQILIALTLLAIGANAQIKSGDGESLLAAIANLQSGQTLQIPEGRYEIMQRMELKGLERVEIIGKGQVDILLRDPENEVVLIIESRQIRLTNLHLQHYIPDEYQICTGGVVNLVQTQDVTIDQCDLNGCGVVGVSGWGNTGITLKNNHIHHNTFAAVNLMAPETGEQILLYNGEEPLPGIVMENNRIQDNGSIEKRREYWQNSVNWLDREAEEKAIRKQSYHQKKKKVALTEELNEYRRGKLQGRYLGVEYGDFAHLNMALDLGGISFWVDGAVEIEEIESHDEWLGKRVEVEWVKRDMDLREFSGAIETGYVVIGFKVLED
jgi:hypothetical protein